MALWRRHPSCPLARYSVSRVFTRSNLNPLPPQGVEASFNQYFGAGTRAAFEGIQKLEATPQTAAPASGGSTATTTAAPAAPAATAGSGSTTTMRWCVPFAADNAFLQTCTTAVAKGNGVGITFTCVAGGSNEACLDLISRGGADLLLLGGGFVVASARGW